ncbi:MAG TPA: DUF6492 family protein [Pirellulales bacterium]
MRPAPPSAASPIAETIDLVLPLAVKNNAHDDVERCRMLLESLALRFDPRSLGTVFLVVQAGFADHVEGRLRELRLPLRVLDEREVVGETSISGWRKQQLIKLAIAERTTEFYLCLDADVLCRRPVGYRDLVPDGRARVGAWSKRIFPDWYRASAETLGVASDDALPAIGVTPQMLCRDVVALLARHLERRHRRPWREVLGRSEAWTEYCLYGLVLEHYGLFDLFHVWGDLSGGDVWKLDDFHGWSAVRDAPGFFSVVQSNTGLSPEAVRARLPPTFFTEA